MQTFHEESLLYLLNQYANDQLTETEAEEFFKLIHLEGARELLEKMAETESNGGHSSMNLPEANWHRIWEKIEQAKRSAPVAKRQTNLVKRFRMVAILLLVALGAVYFLYNRNNTKSVPIAVQYKGDVAPGHNGAVLHLSDGSTVVLDSAANGTVALQGDIQAVKINGGLKYVGKTSEAIYNTITTDKGRQWQLQLPDGSKVWLNAASSIRYPLGFTGKERMVEITGEAYFEVKHNDRQPFIVRVNNKAEVQVMGTHFNVNAYDNESHIATTLLEGRVQVKRLDVGNAHASVTLQPGQQAEWKENSLPGGINLVKSADIDKIMAWKNGLFNFEGASLEEVMRQLERWYDIDVVFEKPKTDIRFGGKMTKGITLNEMLEILKGFEGSDLKFRLEGKRKLVVSQ